MKKYIFSLATLAFLVCSCGGGNEYKVSGCIEGASDTTAMVLESSSNGYWFFVDSVKPNSKGEFSVKQEAPEFPGVYRLRIGDQSVYFPVDSIDNIEVNSKLATFATDYTLAGSDIAVAMMKIDKKAKTFVAKKDTKEFADWKTDLANQVLADPSGILAYYVINKYIGDEPVFSPLDNQDFKIIGAVANAYNTFRPRDPRTQYLVNVLLDGQRRRRAEASAPTDTIYASELPIIDVDLQDNNGKQQKLSSYTTGGKVVLLCFTLNTADFSPVFNKALADAYRKFAGRGFEIYQIGYDDSEFQWRQAANNLPWVTVYDAMGVQSQNLVAYNVMALPTLFVINRQGEVCERITDYTRIESTIAKYL